MRKFLVAIWAIVCLTGCISNASAQSGNVIIENGIEYSNPDNQHLMVDMARPEGQGPFPAVLCIHGGGFRAELQLPLNIAKS